MDLALRERFLSVWDRQFPGAERPLTFSYADSPGRAEEVERPEGWSFFVCQLGRARAGRPLALPPRLEACPKRCTSLCWWRQQYPGRRPC